MTMTEHRCGLTAAAENDHTSGGMIALMPTAGDAARLAVPGGEPAAELHLTLQYLGDDGSVFTPEERTALVDELRMLSQDLPPLVSKIFGIAHWNADGDTPSWVWNVGDQPDGIALEAVHEMAEEAVWATALDVPDQHCPWAAHVCAEYTDDLSLAPELEQRLGEVTFDRIRVSFGDEDHDIPLTGDPVTASAAWTPRRELTPLEVASRADFASVHHQWEAATTRALGALASVTAAWRLDLRQQITQRLAADDPGTLPDLTLDTHDAAGVLLALMEEYAVQAGRACQREAEAQGVTVPDWHIPDGEDAVTAALGGRRLLRSVADFTSDLIAGSMLQAAKRTLSGWLRSKATPEAVAGEVDRGLADDQPGMRGAVGSAMTAAQNAGRLAVFEAAPDASLYAASEINDRRTCTPCKQADGREFDTLEDAIEYYPVMGYRDCAGAAHGNACRGFLIALWQQVSDADEPSDVTASAGNQRAASGAAEGDTIVTTATDAQTEGLADKQCPPGMEPGPDGDCVKVQASSDAEALAKGEPNPGTKKDKRLKENKTSGEAEALAHGVAAEADTVQGKPLDAMGDGQTAPWRGPLTVEGIETGDGREFKPDALTWADLPLPLRWNKEDSHGGEPHTVAVNVGRIDKIWREDGGLVMGEGVLDLSDEDGQRVHDKIKNQMLRGVSVDVDSIKDADMELVWPTDPDADGEGDPFAQLFASPEKVVFNKGRIRAATLVDIPAFVAGGEPIGAMREVRVPRAFALTVDAPVRPPAAWFADPALSVPTGITVTPEGRVYGHAALWGTCHIGQAGVCVTPPQEEAHPYFMTGNVWTENGASVQVGQITVGTGHAPLSYGYRAASDHYDNTGAAVADVAVGNDGHGIWVAGSIRPGTDESRIRELRAAGQVSGDWRRIGGSLRLVGLLAVNVPGFPVPKLRTHLASNQQLALVAAGIPQLHETVTEADLDQWAYRRVLQTLSRKVHGEE
jgi:2'-5' RNA ligase